jgi:hypothetical protein
VTQTSSCVCQHCLVLLSVIVSLDPPQYFNVSVETPNGDMALLEKVMEGACAPVDEAAEERKGGAGELALLVCG